MRQKCNKFCRYGRDDEELLGLRFCNEVVVAADQIHPPPDREDLKKDNKTTDDSNKADDNAFKPSGMDAETIPKIKESSVKPTNQRVHPTVSFQFKSRDGSVTLKNKR